MLSVKRKGIYSFLIFWGVLIFNATNLCAQIEDEYSLREFVLNESVKDSLFTFGEWNEKGQDELRLKYLGKINTKNGAYKVMTSFFIWGYSRRGTSRILFFDENNNYLGDYYVEKPDNLPNKIQNNELFFLFTESDEQRDPIQLSFEDGIPEHIFIGDNLFSYDEENTNNLITNNR